MRMTRTTPAMLALLLAAAGAAHVRAQGMSGPADGRGVDREAMWYAPTAEDWKKPVLVEFQRTWEDALAVAAETNRAILVCVNMDGEIASEHYAGVRYRQPEVAALYEPYVCVIASVYRHTPRDFDESGRRILCPRFGSVTCGEHIAIEPILFEKFFDGKRIAPRHVMVELTGAASGGEVYDVYYTWDTQSVFDAVRRGIEEREATPIAVFRGELPVVERVASRHVEDRAAVEAAWIAGGLDVRRALLQAAAAHPEAAPTGLLRLALTDVEDELNRLAREALAKSTSQDAAELIGDALQAPIPPQERDALVAALDRLGQRSPLARKLAVVHRGLAGGDRPRDLIDVEHWNDALGVTGAAGGSGFRSIDPGSGTAGGGTYAPAIDPATIDARLQKQNEVLETGGAEERLELAEAFLARTQEDRLDPSTSRLLLLDAQRAASEAEALGAGGWRTHAVLSITAYYLGDVLEAQRRAEEAVRSGMPEEGASSERTWNAMAVLAIFAQARQKAIADAVRAKSEWPPQWLADVNDAYTVLARHPFGQAVHVVAHHDFLKALGARRQAERVLDSGLARFPESPELHERLRVEVLERRGAEGLEPEYAARIDGARKEGAAPDVVAQLETFGGIASIVAAEYARRAGRDEDALAGYDRAIARFDRSAAAPDGADHYAALALAGRARIALEHGALERALEQLVASFERSPGSAGTLDGLNVSPADTSRTLRARLAEQGRDDLVTRLDAALSRLDPRLLELPAFERGE